MTLTFDLPLPEALGNHRMHWAVKAKRRKAYWSLLDQMVTIKLAPKPPRLPFPKAQARIELRTFRRMDDDNAHARLKDLLDWLQSRGYIQNDKDLRYELTTKTAGRDDLGVTLALEEA